MQNIISCLWLRLAADDKMMTFEYVARTFRTTIEYRIAIIAYKVSDLAHLLCK